MAQANATFIITLALILMGFLIKKYNFISEKEGKVLSKFLMHTTFPALMIISKLSWSLHFSYYHFCALAWESL
jgi:predicted permease